MILRVCVSISPRSPICFWSRLNAWKLWRNYSDALARKAFWFSTWHLSLLFAALLGDHYLQLYP